MAKLPQEVLLQIVKELPRRDQFRWVLVNRWWCEWLRRECLFTELHLHVPSKSDNILDSKCSKILDWLKKNNYGYKTRRLILNGSPDDPDFLSKIVETLPNIEDLKCNSYFFSRDERFVDTITKWKYLKRFEDWEENSDFNRRLLSSSSPCAAQLESIVLRYITDGLDEDFIPSTEEFQSDVSRLKYAPNLQSLTIETAGLTRDILFGIHDTLPRLKSLTLKNPERDVNSDFYPENDSDTAVRKVESLDHLYIDDRTSTYGDSAFEFLIDVPSWMKFITETYTDLKSFYFFVYPGDVFRADQKAMYDYLSIALNNWKNLQSFGCNLCLLDEPLLDIMRKNGVKLQDLTIYMNDKKFYRGRRCPYDSLRWYPEVIRSIRTLCVQQTHRSGYMTDSFLTDIFAYMPNAETLKLQAFKKFKGFGPEMVLEALDKMPKLTHVEAHLDAVGTYPGGMRSMDIRQLSQLVDIDITQTIRESVYEGHRALTELARKLSSHCPLLENFKARIEIDEDIDSWGAKKVIAILPFKDLLHLKRVRVAMNYDAIFELSIHHKASSGRKKRIEKVLSRSRREREENMTARVAISVNQDAIIYVTSESDSLYR